MEKNKYINDKEPKRQTDVFLLINAANFGINAFRRELFFNHTKSIQQLQNKTYNRFYSLSPYTINSDSITAINNSFAMKLAKTILQKHSAKSLDIKSNDKIKTDYYDNCVKSLSNISDDVELLKLHLKQMTLIINNNSSLNNSENHNLQNHIFSNNIRLYIKILWTFWNRTDWSLLFPSMPEAALNLMKNRNLLIDLLLNNNDKFRIDQFANSFIKKSTYGKDNNLLFISFLDFTIFSWFEHFGIINYLKGKDIDPVFVKLTKHGRKMLGYLALW